MPSELTAPIRARPLSFARAARSAPSDASPGMASSVRRAMSAVSASSSILASSGTWAPVPTQTSCPHANSFAAWLVLGSARIAPSRPAI